MWCIPPKHSAEFVYHMEDVLAVDGTLQCACSNSPAANRRRRVAEALGLPRGGRTQFSVRVRLIDGLPFAHLTTHVPETIGVTYTEADLATRPLLSLLERSGVEIEKATQEVTAVLASPDVAAALVRTGQSWATIASRFRSRNQLKIGDARAKMSAAY